ncbi:MAG TPA: ankyrin repeat domain-containing protein [Gemmataceae bacterium]|nr:ankyrin repeat domain-containing protein [Gemmataceae bacterium]
MSDPLTRRKFTAAAAGLALGAAADPAAGQAPKTDPKTPAGPTEAPLERDYPAPGFKPGWKKPQVNRLLVQDFVIYAHSDLAMTQKLLDKEPALLNAAMDWGAGDWETGLGGASHMGRRDIALFLLERGVRVDLFCAAMLGQLEVVKALLMLQPKLIDARGPHGISLHAHAQWGGKEAEPVLDYLQSVKKVELKPNPFLKQPAKKPG